MQSSAGVPSRCSTSMAASSGRAEGRSILLITGTSFSFDFVGQEGVGHGLGLHALRGVDHQDRPSQAASARLTS